MIAREGIASRYRITTVSATPPKACRPPIGMNSAVTTRLMSPTYGAARKVSFAAPAGTMVSLPRSLKKS